MDLARDHGDETNAQVRSWLAQGNSVMSIVFSIRAAGLAASLVAGAAMAQSAVVVPGGSVSVPSYVIGSPPPPTATLLAATCGYFGGGSCTTGTSVLALESTGVAILGSNGGFIEVAGTTNLNPYGASDLAIAFIIGSTEYQAAAEVGSVTLSSLSGYDTDVQACGPIFGAALEACATGRAGIATRSAGTGNSITFANPDSPAYSNFLPFHEIPGGVATDGYVIYTNAPASALVDPDNFTVAEDGVTYSFAGLGLTPPSVTPPPKVPEPATLGLLTLGLAGLRLMRRKR
jgi:hypothetical protein